MKQVHDADELSEACSEAREVEKQYPGQEQPVRDIRLENESQVIENVLPPQAAIPPVVLGKAIRRSDRSTWLGEGGLLVGMLEYRALQTHEEIGGF
jgi:hypothetical protein